MLYHSPLAFDFELYSLIPCCVQAHFHVTECSRSCEGVGIGRLAQSVGKMQRDETTCCGWGLFCMLVVWASCVVVFMLWAQTTWQLSWPSARFLVAFGVWLNLLALSFDVWQCVCADEDLQPANSDNLIFVLMATLSLNILHLNHQSVSKHRMTWSLHFGQFTWERSSPGVVNWSYMWYQISRLVGTSSCFVWHFFSPNITKMLAMFRLMPPLTAAKVGASWGLGHCFGVVMAGRVGQALEVKGLEMRQLWDATWCDMMRHVESLMFTLLCVCWHVQS